MAASSILAYYKNQQVRLGIEDNVLVFDGVQFVPPSRAKYVALVSLVVVGPEVVPDKYPVTEDINQVQMTWSNMQLCKVISYGGPDISSVDVQSITDPNNGQCVCDVTCDGTELQNVPVTTNVILVPPSPAPAPSPAPVPAPINPPGTATPVTNDGTVVILPTDLPPPESNDTLVPLGNGLVMRMQVLRSIGNADIGLLVTGLS